MPLFDVILEECAPGRRVLKSVSRTLPSPAHIDNRCKSNPCGPVAVRNDGDKRWPSWSNPDGKEPNHRSLGGGTFQRSGVHQGVFLSEVSAHQERRVVCKIQNGYACTCP